MTAGLESCAITQGWHQYKRERIRTEFPVLSTCSHQHYLSIWEYIDQYPQKLYSKKTFHDLLKLLLDLQTNGPASLMTLFKDYEEALSAGFQSLKEINALSFHDVELPDDNYAQIQFCDAYIHPNYVKLTEGVYANLIAPITVYLRIKRSAKLGAFKIYDRVQELKNSSYDYLAEPYSNIVRNGIAHGGVSFSQRNVFLSVTYRDDKGNSETLAIKDVTRHFDDMLDICNGLALAFRIFFLSNTGLTRTYNIKPPFSILADELQAETEMPGWKATSIIKSEVTYNNRHELIISTENHFLNTFKLYYQVFRSVHLIVALGDYFGFRFQRYVVWLNSKYSLNGWAAFDGDKLHNAIASGSIQLEDYKEALENNLIFFVPKIKLPAVLFKIPTYLSIMKTLYTTYRQKLKYSQTTLWIEPRRTSIHNRGFWAIIDASTAVMQNSAAPIGDLIRTHCKQIVKKTIKIAKKQARWLEPAKYLPVDFIRIGVFRKDFRARQLKGPGLIPELLCTIEVNKLKVVNTIDIAGGVLETIGNFRIVWNKNATTFENYNES